MMTKSEQARADVSHECAACGGSGCGDGCGASFQCQKSCSDCPACQGAGRISDRMPAKDAMADAETLENNSGVDVAARHGERAIHYGVAIGQEFQAYWRAKRAARVAFRAVPGLRGDK